MEEVFLNIILNALQSMPHGGKLTVSSFCSTSKKEMSIVFKDTGVGMSQNVMDMLFKPFFTTKKSGTGLGLSISKRIVEEHGGALTIASKKGKGTSVTVSLPILRVIT